MPEFFETSFGDQIELIPKFQELFPESSNRIRHLANYYRQVENVRETDGAKEANESLSFRAFVSRYLGALTVIEFLEELQIEPSFTRLLDIGTGFGVQPMIMKGLGLVKHAAGVDWIDRSVPGNEKTIQRHARKLKYWRPMEPLLSWAENSNLFDPTIRYGINKFGHPRIWNRAASAFTPSRESFYGRPLTGNTTLDNYIVDDVFSIPGRYDLITGFAAIYLFPAERLLEKVSELLEDDGIFIWNDPYYWYPVPPSFLVGKFPYTFQRLTPEDFSRYIHAHHPESADDMQKVFDYVPQPAPSVQSYLKLATQFDLVPLGIKRVQWGNAFPQGRGAGPMFLSRHANSQLDDVERNIAQFRDDITMEDLTTGRLLMALRRKPRDKPRLDSDTVQAGIAAGLPPKPEGGKLFELGKRISERIYRTR